MCLHVALHPPHLVLQTPAGSLEGMIHCKRQIGQSFVGRHCAADSHFPAAGQCQMNGDFVDSAVAMMGAERLDQDAAGRQAAKAALEVGNMALDCTTYGPGWIHPAKFNLYGRLHDLPRLICAWVAFLTAGYCRPEPGCPRRRSPTAAALSPGQHLIVYADEHDGDEPRDRDGAQDALD